LKRLETKINYQIEELPHHLHQYRKYQKDLPRKFIFDIDPGGSYKVRDFKFSLQEKEIISLLMGEKLYERKEESIRELIKNSVDACRLKKKIYQREKKSFKPEIIFYINSDTITIEDNGIGMDEYKIENYFLKIGCSFYNSNELSKAGIDFSPLSELGIGFLSCFMIADKISVNTKTDDSDLFFLRLMMLRIISLSKMGYPSLRNSNYPSFKGRGKENRFYKGIQLYAHKIDILIKIVHGKDVKNIKPFSLQEQITLLLHNYISFYDFKLFLINENFIDGFYGFVLKKDPEFGAIPSSFITYKLRESIDDPKMLSILRAMEF